MTKEPPAKHQLIRLPLAEELYSVTQQELTDLLAVREYGSRDAYLAALGVFCSTALNALALATGETWVFSATFLANAGVAVASGTLALVKFTAWRSSRKRRAVLARRISSRQRYRVMLLDAAEPRST